MPKRWLVKRKWLVVLEATTYTRKVGSSKWESAGVSLLVCCCPKIFVVKLFSRKIFLYVFCVQNIFTKKKANYGCFFVNL